MRGRPLLEGVVFLLVWGVLLIPLWRISGRRVDREVADVKTEAVVPDAEHREVWLHLRFSEPPRRFALVSDGEAVWVEDQATHDMEQPLTVAWSGAAPSLDFEAEWASPGRRAIEIGVVTLGGQRARTTVWSRDAQLRERLVFE